MAETSIADATQHGYAQHSLAADTFDAVIESVVTGDPIPQETAQTLAEHGQTIAANTPDTWTEEIISEAANSAPVLAGYGAAAAVTVASGGVGAVTFAGAKLLDIRKQIGETIVKKMEERGVDPTNANAIRDTLNDPGFQADIKTELASAGVTKAAMTAIVPGALTKAFGGAANAAEKVLEKTGLDEKVKQAGNYVADKFDKVGEVANVAADKVLGNAGGKVGKKVAQAVKDELDISKQIRGEVSGAVKQEIRTGSEQAISNSSLFASGKPAGDNSYGSTIALGDPGLSENKFNPSASGQDLSGGPSSEINMSMDNQTQFVASRTANQTMRMGMA